MTAKKTTAAPAEPQATGTALEQLGRLVALHPDQLVTDEQNARKEKGNSEPDAALLASVLRIGVQDPITVRALSDGRFGVIKGQRRAKAAQAAAKKAKANGTEPRPVPAFVRDDLSDGQALLLSVVENTQRRAMTAGDTVNAIAQLELISATEVDRRQAAGVLGMPRTFLKAADKARTLKQANLHEAAGYGFDMIELSELADVEDEPNAASRLARARKRDQDEGKKQRGHWAQMLATLRQEKAERIKVEGIKAKLTAAGVKLIGYGSGMTGNERPLESLTTSAGRRITPKAHAKCPGHAARVARDGEVTFYCTNAAALGHKDAKDAEDAKAKAEERTKRKHTVAMNKQARAAREARQVFIKELCGRKQMSDAAWLVTLTTIMNNPDHHKQLVNRTAPSALISQFTGSAEPEGWAAPFATLINRAGRARRPMLLLAYAAAANEGLMVDKAWQSPSEGAAAWLAFLKVEGYTLSEHEEGITTAATEKPTITAAAPDEDADEDTPEEGPADADGPAEEADDTEQPEADAEEEPEAEEPADAAPDEEADAADEAEEKPEADDASPAPEETEEPQEAAQEAEEGAEEPESGAQGA
ncbi:ParB/RepB/Spo0J family partition protein [Streptomyces sp. NPDC059718]